MTVTKYTYNVTDDFPQGKVNPTRLISEISASSIVTALERIDTNGGSESEGVITGGTCNIWFKAALSAGDKTTLDGNTSDPAGGLIAAHDNSPSRQPDPVNVINPDGTVVNTPMTSNNTPIMNPDIIPPGYMLYVTGAFDDLQNELRGQGAQIEKEVTVAQGGDPSTQTVEGQFLEHQYILGGEFGCHGEGFGDWASMMAYAPASSPTNVPAGTGNANKFGLLPITNKSGTFTAGTVLTGGTSGHTAVIAEVFDSALKVAHIGTGAFQAAEQVSASGATADVASAITINQFVPVAVGSNYYWNVDGSTLDKGEINKDLVPVPNTSSPQAGYYNWDPTADPSLTPVADPSSPNGAYDLYDTAIPLVRQANRIGMFLHEKECCPPNVRGKKFLPHWVMRFYVHREDEGTLQASFAMKFGRKTTANSTDLL